MRLHHHVDMIRHDYPRQEIVIVSNALSVNERLDKGSSNARVRQPSRSTTRPIQLLIMQYEFRPCINTPTEKCRTGLWKGSRQSPRNEDYRFFRNPMWKSSVPEHDPPGTGGKTAGAANKVCQ